MIQGQIVAGFYRCDNCGADVFETRRTPKTRRFNLCDQCLDKVLALEKNDFWGWHWEMDAKRPARAVYDHQAHGIVRDTDDYYPICKCGERREEAGRGAPGIFGGPFLDYCPRCRVKTSVEAIVRQARAIHPEWDDEDWLDMLYRVIPEAFDLRVLPDYWFVLRRAK